MSKVSIVIFFFFLFRNILDESGWKLDFFYTRAPMIFDVNNCQDIWDA